MDMGAARGLLRLIFGTEVFGGGPKGSRGSSMLAYGFAKERDGVTVTGKCLMEPTLTFTEDGFRQACGQKHQQRRRWCPNPETIIKAGFCGWIL